MRSAECVLPTLTFTAPAAVCATESFTLRWQSSNPRARTWIDGLGVRLPATASMTFTGPQSFTGRAWLGCGKGPDRTAAVALQGPPEGSVTPAATSISQGSSTTLDLTTSGASSWVLGSLLGNTITPSSGTGSGAFKATYTGTRSGFDTITLQLVGLCGEGGQHTAGINVIAPSGFLRCCDGTLSPTCRDCNNKQGCCSSHGGVCGCP